MVLALAVGGLSMNAEERVLARVADREIRYSEIACDRVLAERHPRWLNGRTAEEACLDEERRAFRGIISAELLEKAFVREGWSLSADEVERVRSAIAPDEATVRRGQAEARRLPEAVRRVHLGESFEAVYDEAVRPLGHSIEQFREAVTMFRSVEVVDRYLAKDWISIHNEEYRARARRVVMAQAIRLHLEALAAAKKVSVDADDYYRTVVDALPAVVLDPRFSIPAGREILRYTEVPDAILKRRLSGR